MATKAHTAPVFHFSWTGFDADGNRLSGTVRTSSVDTAAVLLKDQGVLPTAIQPTQRKRQYREYFAAKPNTQDVIRFSNQLGILLTGGLSLDKALTGLIDSTEKPRMKAMVAHIYRAVRSGTPFADALVQYSTYFNGTYRALIAVGERTATLPASLKRAGMLLEKQRQTKRYIRAALRYPAIVLVATCITTAVLFLKVIPAFETLYGNTHTALPWLTQQLLALSLWLQAAAFPFVIVVAVCIAAYCSVRHTEAMATAREAVVMRIPLLRTVWHTMQAGHVLDMLAVLYRAGIPLPEALMMIEKTATGRSLQRTIRGIHAKILSGVSFAIAFDASGLFPPHIVQMLTVGEAAGTLAEILETAARTCEEAVQTRIETVKLLIEPVTMLVLGALVGTVVLGMYLPIFQAGNAL